MDNELNKKQAKKVYETICAMFDEIGYKYTRHEEDLVILCTVKGDDIPMDIIISVNADKQMVAFISPIPVKIPDEKAVDMSMAVNVANFGLVDGAFFYDIAGGRIFFRVTACYIESILSKELFKYMLTATSAITDGYNDKFFMLAKGMMTLEQFLKSEEK